MICLALRFKLTYTETSFWHGVHDAISNDIKVNHFVSHHYADSDLLNFVSATYTCADIDVLSNNFLYRKYSETFHNFTRKLDQRY